MTRKQKKMLNDMTIRQLVDVCYEQAKEKGWAEKEVEVPEMIALMHSELSEALEAYRDDRPIFYYDNNGKPQGIASEFADVIIRMGHYCKILKIDLQDAINKKLAYNLTRPHRHGGKKC